MDGQVDPGQTQESRAYPKRRPKIEFPDASRLIVPNPPVSLLTVGDNSSGPICKRIFRSPPSLEFCTYPRLANPYIGGHCAVSGEFWRVSAQSRVVKNERLILGPVTTLHNVTCA